jgi:phenylacetate-CoA ligase
MLVQGARLEDIASILTSSGHGQGGYALGLSTRSQYKSTPFLIDLGLDIAFSVDQRRSLLINCLPMGVTFLSDAACVANVSVREDMACAIVEQTGHLFEQIILCGDPLFLKRLCDYSRQRGLDWRRYRMNAILGEETFTESFRDYLAATLGVRIGDSASGLIGSSMGVGELGLNLFNETRETIALRRACITDIALRKKLLPGMDEGTPLPTLHCFNPLRTFVEVVDADAHGDGDLVVSMLDLDAPVPLMRYKTGDRARLLGSAHVSQALAGNALGLQAPVLPLIALHGRSKDYLPGGWHVDDFKHLQYADLNWAEECSGAFRLSRSRDGAEGLCWELQLRAGSKADAAGQAALMQARIVQRGRSSVKVACHAYEDFPYGKTIDYERKFTYWAG